MTRIEEQSYAQKKLAKLTKRRKKWVKSSIENDFLEGLQNVLTEMYPDSAHFILELLQNAEDAQASEVSFILEPDNLVFKHDGKRLFTHANIESITSIGVSTKLEDNTSIGKFGVGFKSVFAYTKCPEIHSGEYHFRIRDLVIPDTEEVKREDKGKNTYFLFPFNHPKKSKEQAVDEIQKGLLELSDDTLLFLTNINRLNYSLPNGKSGYIRRISHKNNRSEIRTIHRLVKKDADNDPITKDSDECINEECKSNWLKFTNTVKIKEVEAEGKIKSCDIAIAYQLKKQESNIQSDTPEEMNGAENTDWKIVPVEEGQVAIYFPAVKETSKLLFHMHAPFASTVARDSIRDCEENKALRDQLAALVVKSLTEIRKLGLLTVEFLNVLPIPEDRLKEFYLPFQDEIIVAFKTSKLTPTMSGKHEKATTLRHGSSVMTKLLSEKEIRVLTGIQQLRWSAYSFHGERSSTFLRSLEIEDLDTDDFVEILSKKTSCIPEEQIEPDEDVMKWLKSKPDKWLRNMYATIYQRDFYNKNYQEQLINAKIVRLQNRELSIAKDCYFPNTNLRNNDKYPQIKKGIYSSGDDEHQNDSAKEFLECLGVKILDESVLIETILNERYSQDNLKPRQDDLKHFINFIKAYSYKAHLFHDYFLFKIKGADSWSKPRFLFLDEPLFATDLRPYYEESDVLINGNTKKNELDQDYYLKTDISKEDLLDFATAVGVEVALKPLEEDFLLLNPKYSQLISGPGRVNKNKSSRDFMIPFLKEYLEQQKVKLSRLFWNMMADLKFNSNRNFEAYYKKNHSSNIKKADSQFIHCLKNTEWVAQTQSESANPEELVFVKPCDAISKKLPDGFRYDKNQEWLKRIEFGQVNEMQSKNERLEQLRTKGALETLGLQEVSQEKIKKIKDIQVFKKDFEKKMGESKPGNDSRYEKVGKDSRDAPRRQYGIKKRKERTQKVHKDDVFNYLRKFYQINDQWACQICWEPMPFLKKDGSECCEKREILNGKWANELTNNLQNEKMPEYKMLYIVLCPNCNRFYDEYVTKRDTQQDQLLEWIQRSDGYEFIIESSTCKSKESNRKLLFHQKHIGDIRAVIAANGESNQDDSSCEA